MIKNLKKESNNDLKRKRPKLSDFFRNLNTTLHKRSKL